MSYIHCRFTILKWMEFFPKVTISRTAFFLSPLLRVVTWPPHPSETSLDGSSCLVFTPLLSLVIDYRYPCSLEGNVPVCFALTDFRSALGGSLSLSRRAVF